MGNVFAFLNAIGCLAFFLGTVVALVAVVACVFYWMTGKEEETGRPFRVFVISLGALLVGLVVSGIKVPYADGATYLNTAQARFIDAVSFVPLTDPKRVPIHGESQEVLQTKTGEQVYCTVGWRLKPSQKLAGFISRRSRGGFISWFASDEATRLARVWMSTQDLATQRFYEPVAINDQTSQWELVDSLPEGTLIVTVMPQVR